MSGKLSSILLLQSLLFQLIFLVLTAGFVIAAVQLLVGVCPLLKKR